jgi:hypothetical protein
MNDNCNNDEDNISYKQEKCVKKLIFKGNFLLF